jgi:mannose-6-phosphate isomerase
MPKNDLRVDLLGTSFTITVDEDAAYLETLLSHYRRVIENTQKTTGSTDPLKTAILAGFLLCDEMEKLRAREASGLGAFEAMQAEQLTLGLIERIDNFLDTVNPDSAAAVAIAAQTPQMRQKNGVFRLKPETKHYDWGSPVWIPRLTGERNDTGEPYAELWLGVHAGGPSQVLAGAGNEERPLAELIGEDPRFYLGKETADAFGTLPYLFKLLAAAKPLSIQAHPNSAQAREGFERENRANIPLDAPERNYKDPNHKPELLCALTPFRAMAGFRQPDEIEKLLGAFACPALAPLVAALRQAREGGEAESCRAFLGSLLRIGTEARQEITAHIRQRIAEIEQDAPEYTREWRMIAAFAALFPGDPAVIAPFYLNVIDLLPGEAVFIPAGILHAYVEGFGVELMAASDNVLRGGLSPKHIDVPELLGILTPEPWKPAVWKAAGGDCGFFSYPVSCKEFVLSVMRGIGSDAAFSGEAAFGAEGPAIIIVTEGELLLTFHDGRPPLRLHAGEAAFIAAAEDRAGFHFSGAYTLFAASPPSA